MHIISALRLARACWVLVVAAVWLASCSTPKDITYFQDAEALNGMALQAEQQFRLRPEDKINIVVNSSNPMLEQQFTLTTMNSRYVLGSSVHPQTTRNQSPGSSQMVAYTVDEQGTITFPVLGKISVGGKTRGEVAQYIQERLVARELVSDPIVTVEYVNLGVNVLGEVNKAGHIEVTKDHFTLLDALAQAGDLTNMQTLLNSPVYYLQQNDLVYVAPNDKRKRESRATGNTFNTPAVWISLASLITTITALIIK